MTLICKKIRVVSLFFLYLFIIIRAYCRSSAKLENWNESTKFAFDIAPLSYLESLNVMD